MGLARELFRWADPDAIAVCPFVVTPTVSIMSNFQLNDDDVVSMKSDWSVINSNLFKLGWFKNGLERLNTHLGKWLGEGVECELLSAYGGGWLKGKMHLRLEFIPDEPEPSNPEQTDAVLSPNPEQ
jgi:hypothetical protein